MGLTAFGAVALSACSSIIRLFRTSKEEAMYRPCRAMGGPAPAAAIFTRPSV
jgi:hypothetical protein